jgi:hypothetical protein
MRAATPFEAAAASEEPGIGHPGCIANPRRYQADSDSTTPQVRFHPAYGEQVLACPRCGKAYLHHERVEVFSRLEDASHVSKTTVEGKISCLDYLPNNGSGNPSARRDGLCASTAKTAVTD